jgi:membrane-associated protease RseP (regulator of RpoE activity)
MWLLLLLLTLSIITYILIKRTVTSVTNTPAWLLWLVVMTPPIAWTVWYMVMDEGKSIPLVWIILPLFICFITYGWLISIGRILPENQDSRNSSLVPNLEKKIKTLENPVFIRPITATEEQSLRNCFPWGMYYLQNVDYHPQAIICRGKLRIAPEKAYQSIKTNIERVFGDRFLILFQESLQGQPFFALVANPRAKSQHKKTEQPTTRPLFALGLLLLTLLTTTIVGTAMAGIPAEKWQENLRLLLYGLPYSLGLIIILGIHELSHYLTAIRYKVITTLPYFIPTPFFLGTFGAFIQIKSPIPHRKALFDVGIAGPLGGFMVTVPILLWGLSLSKLVSLPEGYHMINEQIFDPRVSFLFAIFAKLVFGSSFIAGKGIHLHPLAIAGYVGLSTTALNLMPVGQLDGGYIVHGMFGQRAAIIIGQFTRWFVLALGIIRPELFVWAILLFFMPNSEHTALNDVTELDDRRDVLGLFSLALLIMILLPLPGTLAQWLNI